MAVLEARHLTKHYGDVVALDDLTLDIDAGEVFCMLGPNGAGKTTAINLFLGFVKATAGSASIDGLDIAAHPRETKQAVAYIPEQVTLYRSLSGLENLRYFSELAGHREYSASDLEGFLVQCGLTSGAARRRVGTYSKGMRQKVGIAIALAKRARALLLDEPTAGLDPTAANEFATVLAEISARGAAVLMTTHDLFRAKMSGTRIGIMRAGRLVATLDAATIDHSQLESAYLRQVGAAPMGEVGG